MRAKKPLSLALALIMCLSLMLPASAAVRLVEEIEDGTFLSVYVAKSTNPEDRKGPEHYTIPRGVTAVGNGHEKVGIFFTVTDLTIPDGVTSIGAYAFCFDSMGPMNDGHLTTISIPDSVTSIGAHAFENCTNLTSITIPSKITRIEDNTFTGCESLTKLDIPDGVTSIGDRAFSLCTGLTDVELSSSLTSLGFQAFAYCYSLKSITIPDSVELIGRQAFASCDALTDVTLPNNAVKIDDFAFANCTNLTSITIPASVVDIHSAAFHGSGLKTIRGEAGSFAESYAKWGNYDFVAIDAPAQTEQPAEQPAGTQPATEQPSGWAQGYVTEAVAANIVPEALQSKYTQPATRAEFCALAVQLYETVTGKTVEERVTFNDTDNENVEKAAALGVISGVGGGRANPDGNINREQAAVMLASLARACGKPLEEKDHTFSDQDIDDWAAAAIGQVQSAGIMSGTGAGTFSPHAQYTREQSIITMLALYKYVK